MNKAQEYFKTQMQNQEFQDAYTAVSKRVDIEWELERIKMQIKNNTQKETILSELEKLQKFVHNLPNCYVFLLQHCKFKVSSLKFGSKYR
ncbi:MAG: hypothetical protein U9N49_00100 [Campylobacterota bacterium]|nr:hypothetical protein [Campylobacterota bacterium]